ncbi:MAG: YciI family protein [Coriobacteriia bacterium]
MPHYGVLVYLPAPADPAELDPEYLTAISDYPEHAKRLGAKVLGGSYFPGQRGFAFEASTDAVSVAAGETHAGPFAVSPLVPAAFFVLSAPDMEAAVQAARAHPAAITGGIEVRKLYPEPKA